MIHDLATSIAPFYPRQKVITRRHPLFPPVTVTACVPIAPGVWRIEWEYVTPGCTPVTGSGMAAGYVRAGGGRR